MSYSGLKTFYDRNMIYPQTVFVEKQEHNLSKAKYSTDAYMPSISENQNKFQLKGFQNLINEYQSIQFRT